MFAPERRPPRRATAAFALLEQIFLAAARQARASHGNALAALGMHLMQSVVFIAAFYVMFDLLGLRGAAIRGDFILYIVSGVFLFMVHIKAVAAIAGAEGPTSAMMKHRPMNTIIAICGAGLSSLYVSILSVSLILFFVHVVLRPVVIHDPVGAGAMLLLAWFSGCAIGLPLYALRPWLPNVATILNMVYSRVNMIASGKMFVVNMMPPRTRALFDWNPLFHIIDQARGYTFVNYNPMHTSWSYAVWVAVIAVVVGLMGEFYTRRHASLSWSAGR